MSDLKSRLLIVAKGVLFLAMAVVAAGLVLLEHPSWRLAVLLCVLVWASCRFYYFLFYVLEKYVDPCLRYAGLWDMLKRIVRRPSSDDRPPPREF